MKIKTDYDRFAGWHAWDDDTYDGAPDARSPLGWGTTEEEAIQNLKERLEES